jgi:hypothetical protein
MLLNTPPPILRPSRVLLNKVSPNFGSLESKVWNLLNKEKFGSLECLQSLEVWKASQVQRHITTNFHSQRSCEIETVGNASGLTGMQLSRRTS